ncbi:MAG: peptidoglycan editing factor PgeF [Terracidiphilus sp.]|jgi:YfiH family protein
MPSSIRDGFPEREIHTIDKLFESAGLQRSLRGSAAGVTGRMRFERAAPQELSTPAPVPCVAPNGVEWLAAARWKRTEWLWHGFSTRRGGVSRAYCPDDAPGELNLGFTAQDDREKVAANRRLLAEAISGDAATPVIALRQIHSNLVVLAGANDAGLERPLKGGVPGDRSSSLGCKGDGLMTDEPGLLLAIQTADCIPVLVADRRRRAVAAFHAGWRGTVKRIVENGIGRMRLAFGSRPEDLIAAIGPGIGACCYSVGEEVLSEFESQFSYARELFREVYDSDPIRMRYPMLFLTQRAPGHSEIGPKLHVNLVEANRRQLLAAGLKPGSISVVGGCTSCQPEMFFSHRASQGHAGRMMSVIGIRTDAVRR